MNSFSAEVARSGKKKQVACIQRNILEKYYLVPASNVSKRNK